MFGLLTRIRLSRRPMDLEGAAHVQYLFPVVGMIVGLMAAFVALLLSQVVDEDRVLISAGAVLVSLYFITGILHTEGLADFFDGLMASGTQERKRQVMKDAHVGAGGVFAISLFLILFFASISVVVAEADHQIALWPFLSWHVPAALGFVVAEVAGKLSMNTMMFLGPNSHEGMGSVFVRNAGAVRFGAAVLISAVIAMVFVGQRFPVVFLGLAAGGTLTIIARKHFGGVAGDSFGAANEVGRLLTLAGWVLVT